MIRKKEDRVPLDRLFAEHKLSNFFATSLRCQPRVVSRFTMLGSSRVAKPLMVALSIIMIDELGEGPARGS